MALGSFRRPDALERLAADRFDVLVVGGGITGAGVALDAAARGLRTALIERDDFASGTSSKSSKLIHGGLRYLQQGDVRLVYEALHERQRLWHNAPHLVHVLPFLIPAFTGKDGVVPRRLWRALGKAMWMYDLTGGWRLGKLHQRLSAAETIAHMPTLPGDRVEGGYLYYDATADDARLTLTIARTAALDHGAVVANGVALAGVVKDAGGRAVGASVRTAEGDTFDIAADVLVNATGVWADDVRALDEGTHPASIRPAKGIHITVPWQFVRNDIAVVVPVPKDKRSVFVVPWGGPPGGEPRFAYIGTTDTDFDGPLDDPQCTPADIDYLLGAINFSVADRDITRADILGTWAGLRPLVRSAGSGKTADLSRGHQIKVSRTGVVTITGGKLTTYRHMAEDTVDAALKVLGDRAKRRVARRSPTAKLRLRGADGYEQLASSSDPLARLLAERYGGDANVLVAMVDDDASLGDPLVPGTEYVRAEAVYAARHEMGRTLSDILARRTRALLQAREASVGSAPGVAALVAPELGWGDGEIERQVAAYRELAARETESTAVLPS
ncbi:MAG: FAD-dependent oxidoreductase [Acidimicrobiales bacterium]